MSDMRVCRRDGEPLIFTMEFPGAEYICGLCGGLEDLFGRRVPATTELQKRLDELTELYHRSRAARRGVRYEAPPKVGDAGVDVPVCKGCGATPAEGVALADGKPSAWFSRTVNGVTEFACSTACIPAREKVLPW